MVSAAHPLAVDAGLEILRRGGSAVDAAIAVQFMLGFVEAPETGIGGGGFLLYFDATGNQLEFLDGRETAPAAARPDRFQWLGRPAPAWIAVPSGRSVGVPGMVAMLELAHARHGRLPWSELLEPAIRAAQDGVPMPPRLRAQARGDFSLRLFADVRERYVSPAGDSSPLLRNAEYAATLRLLADDPGAFYEGETAAALVARAARRRPWGSDLAAADLRSYQAKLRQPVCGPYREWTVCGAPPPSSGGIAVLQVLGMLESFPLRELGPASVEALHLIVEAQRLAFADRERFLGDPDFVAVPVAGLLDPAYLRERAALIDPQRAMRQVLHGTPPGDARPPTPVQPADPRGGTSHFTIVDAAGNAVALTGSIEAPFGSRMASGGFLLNNQLTDFSFSPAAGDAAHPNAVAPGKRPRSSMSPVMVFDADGELRLAVGARGGPRIIAHVTRTLVAVLDWELELQEAINQPNFGHAGGRLELERGSPLAARQREFRARGHRVREVELASGLHGIERAGDGWRGGADPRLDGTARGD